VAVDAGTQAVNSGSQGEMELCGERMIGREEAWAMGWQKA